MDTLFTDTPLAGAKTGQWSVQYDQTQLSVALQQAAARAGQSGQAILASVTFAVRGYDALEVFSAFKRLHIGDRFFWEKPVEHRAIVGVGIATSIETDGDERVAEAAIAWRTLHGQAVISQAKNSIPTHTSGPIFFGGFTFDTLRPATDLWAGFSPGLLVLPELLYHCDSTYAGLTVNTMISAGQDIEAVRTSIETRLTSLATALQTPTPQLLNGQDSAGESLIEHELLPAEVWKRKVSDAVQMIRQGEFQKVVLARSITVTNPTRDFDIEASLQRLRQSYPKAYVFAIGRGNRYFVGATPERLVCGMDGQLQTMALAGSAPRGETPEEDEHLGRELLNSQKNQGEHQVVVDTIRQALAGLCSHVWTADAPHLLKVKNIQHLETPIMGDLLPGRSILEAIEDLHPTPAVGGYPRAQALQVIREIEELDRGWYASPVGWIGTSGNGEFAVALRSGLVEENKATLFAGCGIVADSDPESEYQESCLKLQVMLRGLSGEQ